MGVLKLIVDFYENILSIEVGVVQKCHNNVTIPIPKNKNKVSVQILKPLLLAEREGFEPSVRY